MLTLEVSVLLDIHVCYYWYSVAVLFHHLITLIYFGGGRAYSNAYFGAGSGPIFLDDVHCTSRSTQLLECWSRPILSHNCLHSADAGAKCEGIHFKLV